MFVCPQCQAELIDGQVLCRGCGYDQRKSVGRPGMHKGMLALVIIIGVLLVPAALVAFCVACVGSAVLMMSVSGNIGAIEQSASLFGIFAAAVVLAAGSYLIYWLVNCRRHPSEWTEPAPLPPAEPNPLPASRDTA